MEDRHPARVARRQPHGQRLLQAVIPADRLRSSTADRLRSSTADQLRSIRAGLPQASMPRARVVQLLWWGGAPMRASRTGPSSRTVSAVIPIAAGLAGRGVAGA